MQTSENPSSPVRAIIRRMGNPGSPIRAIVRRVPIVHRLARHLLDLHRRVGELKRIRQDRTTMLRSLAGDEELGELADIVDSRIAHVRQDIELAIAPVVHQLQDRIARLEQERGNVMAPPESAQELQDRTSRFESSAQELQDRVARLEQERGNGTAPPESAQELQDRMSRFEISAQELQDRVARLEQERGNGTAPPESAQELQDRMSRFESSAQEVQDRMTRLESCAQGAELRSSKMAAALVREEWRYLCPKDVAGVDFVRIGRGGDGGYVMLNDLVVCRHGISIGVGQELSWDLAVADQGINLALYDHTIGDLMTEHGSIKFRRFGARPPGSDEPNKMSLPEIISAEGLDAECNMLLKIDIEGDEWAVLKGISSDLLKKFSQILLELHGMCDFASHDKHLARMYVLNAIAASHQCIHLHANNWGDYRIIGGIPVPDVVEATFASRAHYSFRKCERRFPTGMDYPNNADRAEFMIVPELLGQDG